MADKYMTLEVRTRKQLYDEIYANRAEIERLRGEIQQVRDVLRMAEYLDASRWENETLPNIIGPLVRENYALREAERWVSVSERLPEDNVWCIVGIEGSCMASAPNMWFGYRHNKSWYGPTDRVYLGITHWKPLPEQPTRDGNA